MTVQEAKESIEYLKMQLTEDLEMICFTGDELKALDIAIQALEEVEQYRALGTVEELKEAREKQVAKKPKHISLTHEQRVGNCPCCNKLVGEKTDSLVCTKCLQALKWGEEE